jgi:hypothetical protein
MDASLEASLVALYDALDAMETRTPLPPMLSDCSDVSDEDLCMRYLDDTEDPAVGYAAAIAIKVVGRELIHGIAIEEGRAVIDAIDEDGTPMIESWRARVFAVDRVLTAVEMTPRLFSRWKYSGQPPNAPNNVVRFTPAMHD